MDVFEFFAALAKRCEYGKCSACKARDFCYTAPLSMDDKLINQTIDQMGLRDNGDKRTHKVDSIH